MRILIAEDDSICRRVLTIFFNRLGYEVKSVKNGAECFEEAIKNSYDLIVTDIDMPEMTGLECTAALRKTGSDVFIVAVTASCCWPDPREHCLGAGMNEFIAKPFDVAHLMAVLREAHRVTREKQAVAH
jgi:two-component system, sensor histidine kinase LadS